MFQQIVIRVMSSAQGQRLIDDAVRRVIEDARSSTRAGLMRVARGVAKDLMQDNNEREQSLRELDANYQIWAQQRREEALAEAAMRKALAHAEAMADRAALVDMVAAGSLPAAADPLHGYVQDAIVRIKPCEPLFEGRIGRIVDLRLIDGWPEVLVELEGNTRPMSFAPAALELLDAVALPLAIQREDQAPTEVLPRAGETP